MKTGSKKTILIIGAGVAGLSAGCYGQMNGYHTQIFELHTLPGGLCTSWKRKGYTIDGCIHWLVGSGQGSMRQIWAELGAVQGRTMIDHDEFIRLILPGGETVVFYTNADRLEKHLLEISPGDAGQIRKFCSAVRLAAQMPMPEAKPREAMGLGDMIKMIPMIRFLGPMKEWGAMSMNDVASRFQNPVLKKAFEMAFGDAADMPAAAFIATLGYMHKHNAGYPLGGSLAFSQAIEQRYLSLGGEIHYGSRVEKILTEDNRAVGVRLVDGREYKGDIIVSAADGYATIFKMLDGKYVDDEIRGYYKYMPIFQPLVQVSFGVNMDLSQLPHTSYHILEEPVALAGRQQPVIGIKHYAYDPSLAPAGKTVVEVMLGSRHDYWKALVEDGDSERYEAEKKQIALTILEIVEARIPGFKDCVEMVDVATPLTYERYTGNWQGSFEGWMITPDAWKDIMAGKEMRKTLPGLENFYMIGQWVEPGGGLPPAAMSARKLIYSLCLKDKKKFSAAIN